MNVKDTGVFYYFLLIKKLNIYIYFCYSVYMSWAAKRQFKYLLGIFGVFALIVVWIIYPIIFKNPTCSDGKQNGTETGIDCGGSCSEICSAQTASPVVVWNRAFPVTGNIYNLVAYVENPNRGAAIANINYEFRIYGTNNKLIGRRLGSTYIPPDKDFVVFEPRFNSGQSKIRSISFEFLPPFVWQKKKSTLNTLPIKVNNIVYSSDINSSSLSAQVENDSIYNIPAFNVIAVLYDINNNAINVSDTRKEGLASNDTLPIIFTWPEVLSKTPVKHDVLVQINPFSVSF